MNIYMTELWTFMEKPIVSGEHDTQNERDYIGGLSLSQFFCKNKPSKDRETYPFFDPFIIPHGLVCDSYPTYNQNQDSDTEEENKEAEPEADNHFMCPRFDKLFFLAAKDLGKSRSEKTKTRKKIPR